MSRSVMASPRRRPWLDLHLCECFMGATCLWSRSSPPRWAVLLGRAISGNASSRRPSARRGGLFSRVGSWRVSLGLDLEVALGCGMPLMGDSLATAGSAERSTLPVCHSSTQHFSLVFYILFGLCAVPTQYRQVREAGSDLACFVRSTDTLCP